MRLTERRRAAAALALALLWAAPALASVLTYHNSNRRHGLYVVPGLTFAAAGTMHRDTRFAPALTGQIFAQPLYWRPREAGPGHVVVATEANIVYALDEATGAIEWQTALPPPVPHKKLPCGNIDPLGITGTPVIDPATARVYFDAQTLTADGPRHKIYALSLSDGAIVSGWPLDVQTAAAAKGTVFDSSVQNERSAVLFFKKKLYVNYGGNAGDCGAYHGTVIEIDPAGTPALTAIWQTRAQRGGIWAQGGIAGDGVGLFVTTGNTIKNQPVWMDGEAVIRLRAGLAPATRKADYFVPSNWMFLDEHDKDLGGTEALPLNVLGSGGQVARRVLAFGKDGNAYLLDRQDLGGIGGQSAILPVSPVAVRTAPAVYETAGATLVAFANNGTSDPSCAGVRNVAVISVAPGGAAPMSFSWCKALDGAGAPIVTTTDRVADPIVWMVGAEGDNKLHGFNALTGAEVFDGGGFAMSGLHHFVTVMATHKRLYVAADNTVYAFTFTP